MTIIMTEYLECVICHSKAARISLNNTIQVKVPIITLALVALQVPPSEVEEVSTLQQVLQAHPGVQRVVNGPLVVTHHERYNEIYALDDRLRSREVNENAPFPRTVARRLKLRGCQIALLMLVPKRTKKRTVEARSVPV